MTTPIELTSIQDYRTRVADLKKSLEAQGETLLKTAFQQFFKENPEIHAIQWVQYTPYSFNDGEPCRFNVYGYDFAETRHMETAEGDDEYEKIDAMARVWDRSEESERARVKVRDFTNSVEDDELFEMVFGDDVKVYATREGFKVVDHNHD